MDVRVLKLLHLTVNALPVGTPSWGTQYRTFQPPTLANTSSNFALVQTSTGITNLNSPFDTRMNDANVMYQRAINNVIYHYKPFVGSSDSRLKYDQRPIHNARGTIIVMKPRLYENADSLDSPAPNRMEAAFVAQQIDGIPALPHTMAHQNAKK